MNNHKIIFATQDYQYLQNEIIENGSFQKGIIITKQFPDGEIYHQIETQVLQQSVVLIGGTIDDKNTLELYDLAHGIIQAGAKSLSIIIPYFGYATMERAVKAGEIVKAKNRALLFSSLPACAEPNTVFLLDLHSDGIPYYFGSDVRCKHVYAKKIVMDIAQEIGGNQFVLAATDAGRAKWVESLANEMNVKSAFVYKHRMSGDETQITGVNADVKDKIVIIYDDMIRTGGSLMQAAKAYAAAGATSIFAITTHGLFTNNALQKIKDQGLIKKVYSTNSHPNSIKLNDEIVQIKSIAGLLKNHLIQA
jgi:ribose-phosphate pyrophosphokinase